MKHGSGKFITLILFISFLSSCELFYPPGFYDQIVNYKDNKGGDGKTDVPGGGGGKTNGDPVPGPEQPPQPKSWV